MDSIWFQTEENPKTDSTDSIFLGIYTQDPSKIGFSLMRPITPFQPTNSIQTQLASPMKSSSGIIYSQPGLFSNHINDFEPIIENPVKTRRDSNSDCQFNLIPV